MQHSLFRSRRGVIVLTLLLCLAIVVSYFDFLGHWRVFVFGYDYGWSWDPDSAYVGSGITLMDQRYTSFIGHPGLPLLWLIQATSRVLYWFSGAWLSGTSFHIFAAHEIFLIVFISRIQLILLNIASIYIVYRLARMLLNSVNLAELTALTYATSFPVLFYFNKIMPEPIFVSLAIAAFLLAWSIPETFKVSRSKAAIHLVILASLYVGTLYTKLTVAIPLIFFIPYMVLHRTCRARSGQLSISRKEILTGCLLFLISTFAFLMLGGYKMNWSEFLSFWFKFAPGGPTYDADQHWLSNLVTKTFHILAVFPQLVLDKLQTFIFPSSFGLGIFQVSEALVMIGALPGALLFWREFPEYRENQIWLIAFGAVFVPIAIFRNGLHYFLIPMAIASIFFVYGLHRLIQKTRHTHSQRGWVSSKSLLVLILFAHGCAIVAAVESKGSTLKSAKSSRELFLAAQDLNYGERIGLVRSSSPTRLFGEIGSYIEYKGVFYLALEQTYYPLPAEFTQSDIHAWRVVSILSGNGFAELRKTDEYGVVGLH